MAMDRLKNVNTHINSSKNRSFHEAQMARKIKNV